MPSPKFSSFLTAPFVRLLTFKGDVSLASTIFLLMLLLEIFPCHLQICLLMGFEQLLLPLQDIWLSSQVLIMNKIAPGPIGNTAGISKLTLKEINDQARDYIKLGEKMGYSHGAVYRVTYAGSSTRPNCARVSARLGLQELLAKPWIFAFPLWPTTTK
ncbi:hypothetical protein LguiB_001356 [Lonicera macranthoides]